MKKKYVLVLVALVLLIPVLYLLIIAAPAENKFIWTERDIDRLNGQYSFMTINIGNSDWDCTSYKWKLCKKAVEQHLTENIQIVQPEIITLQEVLAPWQCEDVNETDSTKVCSEPQNVPQIRRLLGDGYSILCEPNRQYECFGVRKDVGEIEGCPRGGLCYSARTYLPPQGCDPGFSISAITVKLDGGTVFDLANAHPSSTSASCRAEMFLQAFVGDDASPPIVQNERVLIMGDFNIDPWREKDESVDTWNLVVEKGWAGRRYQYHSGIAETDPPHYTLFFVVRRTLDFAASNFASGVFEVLGETPGTSRFDGGAGNDHRALYGILEIKP
jgi:hypothetical protein